MSANTNNLLQRKMYSIALYKNCSIQYIVSDGSRESAALYDLKICTNICTGATFFLQTVMMNKYLEVEKESESVSLG